MSIGHFLEILSREILSREIISREIGRSTVSRYLRQCLLTPIPPDNIKRADGSLTRPPC